MSSTAEADSRHGSATLRDRYVLEERLDQGRFGTVHKATDRLRAHGGRPHVAILMLPAEISRNQERLRAFGRELGAVSRLSHPNIVGLYDLDHDGDRHFVVLEWIDGESLRSIIDTLAPETVCESDAFGVVRAVGSALIYAHAKGVVHGDVRAENVVVTDGGDVALHFAPACLSASAPFAVSPRDDVRGLAALAYELMTGVRPPAGGLYGEGSGEEPPPIGGLGRKRWKALKSALSPRGGRISTVRQLLAALDLEPDEGGVSTRGRGGVPAAAARRRAARRAAGNGRRRSRLASAGLLAAIALAALGALRYGPGFVVGASGWPSRISEGLDRATERAGAAVDDMRSAIVRTGDAIAAYWAEREARAPLGAADAGVDTQAPAGNEAGAEAQTGAAAETGADAEVGADAETGADAEVGADAETGADVDADSGAAPEGDRQSSARAATAGDRPGADERAADRPAADGPRADDRAASDRASSDQTVEGRVGRDPAADDRIAEAPAAGAGVEDAGAEPYGAGAIYFVASEISVSESGGIAAIEVRRTDPAGILSFVWWPRDGTAVAGDDYADLGRVVEQFADGQRELTLYVPIVSDSVPEARSEHFEVLAGVLSGQGNQSGAIASMRVAIVDDD